MISDDMLAVSLVENNTMLFSLANTICQLQLLLFPMENNFWLLWIDVKTTQHVRSLGNKTCQYTMSDYCLKNKKISQIILCVMIYGHGFQEAQCIQIDIMN